VALPKIDTASFTLEAAFVHFLDRVVERGERPVGDAHSQKNRR
jgi:hypothetical protein